MTYQSSNSAALSPEAAQSLAQGLGWFSIGLGLTELMAPRALTRALGMEGHETLVQAYGLREIATGIGILSSKQPAPWVWGRVGGDALDITSLMPGLRDDNPQKHNVGLALAAVAGVTALDIVCAQALSANGAQPQRIYDYSDRTGLPGGANAMRGAASDFEVPRDFRTPEALRPYPKA
jgi:hypothetical protein